MTRRELIESLKAAAEPVYGEREAAAVARLVAERRYGLSRAEVALHPGAEVAVGDELNSILADLAAARPAQYILGVADFDGLELAVGEGVLVPRPETEELVRWVADDSKNAETILDIGTGSGAIAIALARRLPGARVTAIDISGEALRWARANNERTGAGVTMIEADILATDNYQLSIVNYQLDVIVSNPPYIPASERAVMAANVVRHEPAGALFVPDDDPLIFYRAIAKFARRFLSQDGALYFEIHETLAREVAELLAAEGFREIETRRDINDKPRMIKCRP
ncbi:MAG: peptide chain release factor N(5)-glutamine methyltransferase [Alistipes sp.]|jgi:release factor glutamine methyltransferase|nr:peptide chain release factor N(5)-glutamine methyltransferase [Alistipes sp.]